jgi:hypothetical protein
VKPLFIKPQRIYRKEGEAFEKIIHLMRENTKWKFEVRDEKPVESKRRNRYQREQ